MKNMAFFAAVAAAAVAGGRLASLLLRRRNTMPVPPPSPPVVSFSGGRVGISIVLPPPARGAHCPQRPSPMELGQEDRDLIPDTSTCSQHRSSDPDGEQVLDALAEDNDSHAMFHLLEKAAEDDNESGLGEVAEGGRVCPIADEDKAQMDCFREDNECQEECMDGRRDLDAEEKAAAEEEAQEDVSDESEEVAEDGDRVEVSVQDLFTVEVEACVEEPKVELLAVQGEEDNKGNVTVLIQEKAAEEDNKGNVTVLIQERAAEQEAQEDVSDESEEVAESGDPVEVSVQDLLTVEVEACVEEPKVELLAVQGEEDNKGTVTVLIQEKAAEEDNKGNVTVLIQEKAAEEEAQEHVSDESEEVAEGGDRVEVSVQDLLTVEVEACVEEPKVELLAVQGEEDNKGKVTVLIQEEEDNKGSVAVLIQEEDEGDCKVFVHEELEGGVGDQSSIEILASVEAERGKIELDIGEDDVQPVISSVSAVASEPSRLDVPFMMFSSILTAIHPTGLLPSIVVGTIPTPLGPLWSAPLTIQKDTIAQPSTSVSYWNEIIAASSYCQQSLTPSSLA